MNTSCFACKGGECIALDPAPCFYKRPRPCRFFKTQAQADAGIEHALALIAAKPTDQQKAIADLYYGGTMPWKDGDSSDR